MALEEIPFDGSHSGLNHGAPVRIRTAAWQGQSIEVDIGCSSGEFLCRSAKACPERTFIGIEISTTLAVRASQRADDMRLENVTVFNGEASKVLSNLGNSSLSAIHIYFPTPYPRTIGLRHSLIRPKFLRSTYLLLELGGYLQLMTDHSEYYRSVLVSIHTADLPWRAVPWVNMRFALSDGFVSTYWERRATIDRTPYRLALLK
jgi:tRNA (guanine-N7-)-methyltransferase